MNSGEKVPKGVERSILYGTKVLLYTETIIEGRDEEVPITSVSGFVVHGGVTSLGLIDKRVEKITDPQKRGEISDFLIERGLATIVIFRK